MFVVAVSTALNIPRAELCWRGCLSVDGALRCWGDSLEAVWLFGLKFARHGLHQSEGRAIPKSTMHGMLTTFLKRYLQCWKPPEGGFNRTCEAGSFWVNVLASTLHVASNQCWDVVAVIRFNRSSLGPFLLSAAKLQAGPRLQDSRERFALEAEAESLRQSVEKMAMQVVVAAAFLLLHGGCACGSDLVMTMKSVDVLRFTSLTRLVPYLTLGCFSLSLPASTQTYSVDWERTLYWNLLISVAEGSLRGT